MAATTSMENTIILFKLAPLPDTDLMERKLHHPKLQRQLLMSLDIVKPNLLCQYFIMKGFLISITLLLFMSQLYMAVCKVKEIRSRT